MDMVVTLAKHNNNQQQMQTVKHKISSVFQEDLDFRTRKI